MSTSTGPVQNTVRRLQLITSRFQVGAISPSESETFERECLALADRLHKEGEVWKKLGISQAAWSPARFGALVSLVSACLHVNGAVHTFLDSPGKLRLLAAASSSFSDALWTVSELKLPTSSRQAVVKELLLARMLQGCSRQLASLAEVLAPKNTTQDSPTAQPPHSSLEALSPECNLAGLLGPLVCLLCQVRLFSAPGPHPRDDSGGGEEERVSYAAEELVGQQEGDNQQKQHGVEDGRREWGGAEEAGTQQQQAHVAAGPGKPPVRERLHDLLQEVLSEISSSGVLEHLSRCVLLLAGRLQGGGEAGEGQAQGGRGSNGAQRQQQQHRSNCNDMYLHRIVFYAGGAYNILMTLTQSPGLLDGDCGCPADPGSGRPGAAHDTGINDEMDTAPLGTFDVFQGPTQVSLLRQVLSGPCARHLVLCAGLTALSALDGGTTYGMPGGAGLQQLMPAVLPTRSELVWQRRSQTVQLNVDALLNLLNLLAMRPCDPEAEPPGRAMRLQLTLRVARAAVAAAASATATGRSQGGPQYYLERGDAAMVAVQALHFALRHMPPPGDGQGDGDHGSRRRLRALRRWAALAEEVARKAAPERSDGHGNEGGAVGRRLGLLLGLDPRLVRPETPGGECGLCLCTCGKGTCAGEGVRICTVSSGGS